jgi:HEAT repeat protein
VTFEDTIARLASTDPRERSRAVELLKAAAYPEAAVPLAPLIGDPDDDVQLDAIAAELNIFLAEKVTPRRRVGFIVEIGEQIAAEPIFSAGPSALGPQRVPLQVPAALVAASIDRTPRVAVEALYAFGALAGEVNSADRAALLTQAAPLLAGIVAAPDPVIRVGALRVVGRVYARRPGDHPTDETLGDAVIRSLNAREDVIREAAMGSLGAMRYDRAVQALSQLFQFYRKGPIAERALDALARIAHRASLPQLVEQMHGNNAALRLIGIEGVARSGDRSRAEAVQAIVKSQRDAAIQLAGHFAKVLLSDGSMDAIVSSLTRSSLRKQAHDYLLELAFGRAAELSRYLADPDTGIRVGVLDALGLSGDPKALPFVEPLAQDKNPDVALAAARAMARLGQTPSA